MLTFRSWPADEWTGTGVSPTGTFLIFKKKKVILGVSVCGRFGAGLTFRKKASVRGDASFLKGLWPEGSQSPASSSEAVRN